MRLSETPFASYIEGFGVGDIEADKVLAHSASFAQIAADRTVTTLLEPFGGYHTDKTLTHYYGVITEVLLHGSVISNSLVIRERLHAKAREGWTLTIGDQRRTYPNLLIASYEISNKLIEMVRDGTVPVGSVVDMNFYAFIVPKLVVSQAEPDTTTTRPPRTPMSQDC